MSIIKTGSFTVTTGGAAQNLVLGFIPSYFYMVNLTNVQTPANDELVKAEWFSSMANATGIGTNYTGSQPAIEINNISSNGFTPFETADDALFIPDQAPYNDGTRVPMGKSTNLLVTDISQAAQAVVTATHSFTTADHGVTWVTFSQVHGMNQINFLRGLVVGHTSTTSFTVDINTTAFSPFDTAFDSIANVITGAPVTTQFGTQIQMTPNYNRGVIGLTLGTSLMTTTSDVWLYYALLDTSANG